MKIAACKEEPSQFSREPEGFRSIMKYKKEMSKAVGS